MIRAGRQRRREGGRTRDGQARSLAEQRDAGRGVANQRDPAPRPLPEHDLTDRVEVKVVGDTDPVEQFGHPPADARIRVGQESLVLTGVAVVEPAGRRASEDECRQGLAACRVNGD
jgi:hypothetical protein